MLLQAAEQAAGAQQHPPAALYVVATPIGNLADITLRAVLVLALADTVACEDTRVGGSLLHHLGLHKPLLALHQHNEAGAAEQVLLRLAAGERVALVSDAGTPAVSDPGARLVAAVTAAGHRVLPIPGASSALAALSVAGDVAATAFSFCGFLPAKGRERESALAALLAAPGSQVLFEAPHRIEQLGAALAAAAPERTVTLVPRADQAVRDRGHDAGRSGAGLAGGRCQPPARRVRAGAARGGRRGGGCRDRSRRAAHAGRAAA